MSYRISTTHTLDGYLVEPGLEVWDYDLNRRIVGEECRMSYAAVGTRGATQYPDPPNDPWWDMVIPDGEHAGQLGSPMNPSRMWRRHPSTGELP